MNLNKLIKKHNEELNQKAQSVFIPKVFNKTQPTLSSIKMQKKKYHQFTLVFSITLFLFTFLNIILINQLFPDDNFKKPHISYNKYLDNLSSEVTGILDNTLNKVKKWQE